mgnify:CR=1 FL=1
MASLMGETRGEIIALIQPQEEVFRHLYMVGWGLTPTVVLRKAAFSGEEVAALKELLSRTGYAAQPTFFPGEGSGGNDPILKALNYAAAGKATMERIAEVTSIDITPVSDDSPFFYKFEKGLPSEVLTLFLIALAGTIVTGALPMAKKRGSGVRGRGILVFGLLGFSFMAAEVVLIQKLMLFIGQPTVTLGIVLVALLVGVLITLGLLARRNEITAMKAGGISLYRAVLPALLLAGVGSVLWWHAGELRGAGDLLAQHAVDLGELLHEVLLGLEPARRVEEDRVVAVELGVFQRLPADRHRVGVGRDDGGEVEGVARHPGHRPAGEPTPARPYSRPRSRSGTTGCRASASTRIRTVRRPR